MRASRRSRSPILSGGRDPIGRRRAVIPFRRGVESETTKHCSYPDHTTRDQNEHGDKTLGLVIYTYMHDTCYCMYPLRSRPNRLTLVRASSFSPREKIDEVILFYHSYISNNHSFSMHHKKLQHEHERHILHHSTVILRINKVGLILSLPNK